MRTRTDDIIISLTRPHHGSIAHLSAEFDGCIASTGFAVLRSVDARIRRDYLWCILRTQLCPQQMLQRASGGNYPASYVGTARFTGCGTYVSVVNSCGAMNDAVTAPADIDLGTGSSGRGSKARTHDQANRAALPALARHIRLRNLSGAIVIDVAGLSPKRRAGLAPAFARVLAVDPLAPRFLGFSALGLAEVLRPRIHPPLHELLFTPHAHGLAALRQAATQIAATPATALALSAAPSVISALNADPVALTQFSHRAGRALVLRQEHALSSAEWRLDPA